MKIIRSSWLAVAGLVLSASTANAGKSSYLLRPDEVQVRARVALITTNITFEGGTLFVHSDGSYRTINPNDNNVAGRVFIEVDDLPVSNDSFIDWKGGSTPPAQHSFNVIGAPKNLKPGSHKVALLAEPLYGAFIVSANANLSIMPNPAPTVDETLLPVDGPGPNGAFDFTTKGLQHTPGAMTSHPLPHVPHLPMVVSGPHDFNGQAVLALASGRSYLGGARTCAVPVNRCGDAMWGLFIAPTSQCGFPNQDPLCDQSGQTSTWTFNDLYTAAEMQAPMYCQAYYPAHHPALATGTHQISLDASEFPWGDHSGGPDHLGEDSVQYRVGAGTRLLVLSGMEISGSAVQSPAGVNDTVDVVDLAHANLGKPVQIASGSFTIPAGKLGVVFFAAKARVFPPDDGNGFGFAKLWITVERPNLTRDPPIIGQSPMGVQQLIPKSNSGRTLSASFLAADDKALPPGQYVVRVHGMAEGVFPETVGLTRELPLVWFGHTLCSPATCQTGSCGVIADGCGGTINCGGCAAPMVCGGNSKLPSVCACRTFTCPAGGAGDCCGPIRDACGQVFQCPCQRLLKCLPTSNPGASVCYIP